MNILLWAWVVASLTVIESKPAGKEYEVCETEECKEAAHVLMNSMNTSVNPCEDFYDYACGNWIKQHPLPATSSQWGQTNAVKERVVSDVQKILSSPPEPEDHDSLIRSKVFYKSCIDAQTMNSRGLQPLAELIQAHGGWPMVEHGTWQPSQFHLQDVLSDFKTNIGMGILMEVTVDADYKNADKNIIFIDQPSLFLSRTILLNPGKYKNQMNAYRSLVRDIATGMNQVLHPDKKLLPGFLNKKIEEIIAFETKLANISADDKDRQDVTQVYNPYTIGKLQGLMGKINVSSAHAQMNWLRYLQKLTKPIGGVSNDEIVIVKQPQYIQSLFKILDETPLEIIANYVQWSIASALITETTDHMREAQFRFDRTTTGVKKRRSLVKKCSDFGLLSSYFPLGYAVGTKYIQTRFTPQAKKDVTEMVDHLRSAFRDMLQSADWLDDLTKTKAVEKMSAMRQFIGYPDWLTNSSAVSEYFHGLDIKEGKHFENQVAILRWWIEKSFKSLRQPVDKNEVKLHPVLLNAMYSPETNAITFPAGILEPVFYRHNGHKAVNFGAIGMVIGHEITHGFDLRGSQYDQDGNAVDWWTPKIRETFERRAREMMIQYSGFETPVGHVDGELTAKENIADNGGLRQAYLSYRNWIREKNNNQEEPRLPGLENLTPDQLFFLGYANLWCQNERPEALQRQLISDEHSPSRFRTLGPSMNFDAFANTWNCPKGSPMNPEKKCVLW